MTDGKVTGIDSSEGMIREVIEKNRGFDTSFEIKSIEEMDIKIVIEYLRSTVML